MDLQRPLGISRQVSMFTGIIKEIGSIAKIARSAGLYRIDVRSREVSKNVDIGGSVAVNGVCLTAVSKKKDMVSFDIMAETIRRTSLAGLKEWDAVNLEGALRAGDPFDGHFVTGHVDCAGSIRSVKQRGGDVSIEIETDGKAMVQAVEKGSVTVDGISLTIGNVTERTFTVFLIPHTLKVTTLGTKKKGDTVNIEFDIVGKYAAKFSDKGRAVIDEPFLREKGF